MTSIPPDPPPRRQYPSPPPAVYFVEHRSRGKWRWRRFSVLAEALHHFERMERAGARPRLVRVPV